MAIKLSELAEKIGCRLHGDDCVINNVADIDAAVEGDLVFIYNPKYLDKIDSTAASAIIIKESWSQRCSQPVLLTDNPRLAFVKAARLLNPEKRYPAGIAASADIATDVSLPATVYIGPNVVIETGVSIGENVQIAANTVLQSDVTIGDGCVIHANVYIGYKTQMGTNCIVSAGSIIGADGFGYEKDGEAYLKVPQLGNVRIGDNVEIGANSTIDRGALRDTILCDGVKVDNLVQIGHNVVIGKHTVICAQSGVAGSTKVGENCVIGGAVAVSDNIELTDNVVVLGRTLITTSIDKPGAYASSMLVDTVKNWRKNAIRHKSLNKMDKRLRKLEKSLKLT